MRKWRRWGTYPIRFAFNGAMQEKAGREGRDPVMFSEAYCYCTVLDQAEVSPDSKPSVKITEAEYT